MGEKDDPLSRNGRRLVYGLVPLCAALLMADLFVHRQTEHPFDTVFGFYGIYGFAAAVLTVLLAKAVQKILGRSEDYYDRD